MINWALARNPVNWAVIVLMLIFAAVAADIVVNIAQSSGSGQSQGN